MKVFDVVLNGDLTVTSDLDIFEKVGRGAAHDEYVEFSVENNKIIYQGEESEISAGKIRVEFIKSYRDNPKINAVVLIKGTSNDWPVLPPLPIEQEPDEIADDQKVNELSQTEDRVKSVGQSSFGSGFCHCYGFDDCDGADGCLTFLLLGVL